jgi:hypothetical protein
MERIESKYTDIIHDWRSKYSAKQKEEVKKKYSILKSEVKKYEKESKKLMSQRKKSM